MKQHITRYILASTFALSLNSISFADEITVEVPVVDVAITLDAELETASDVLLVAEVEETEEVVEVAAEPVDYTFPVEEVENWSANPVAEVSTVSIEVNNSLAHLATYVIEEFNYVKVEDLAHALTKTTAKFDFSYNEALSGFEFITGNNYSNYNFEYTVLAADAKMATRSPIAMYHHGEEVGIITYLIDGYNYVQLDQMSRFLDFTIGWDQEAKRVTLDTKVLG